MKCCAKCAFRRGSPERADIWGWLRYAEHWTETAYPFYCHESVPDHGQEATDDRPRWRLCAGREAMRGKPIDTYLRRTGADEMAAQRLDALVAAIPFRQRDVTR